jgi:predicted RNA methylase
MIFVCLVDEKRTLAYRNAIMSAVKPGDVVADLGTGSGIMAMFAAEAGAKKVYAIEASEKNYKQAKNVFRVNGLKNKIILTKCDARELVLPEKVDVIICEMISTGLIDELQVPVMNHVMKFAKKGARIIPAVFEQYAELVFNKDQYYGYKVPLIRREYEWHKETKSELLTEKVMYSKMNFRRHSNPVINKRVVLKALKNGTANSIRISNKTVFPDNSELKETERYTLPVILPINDIDLKKGDRLLLNIKYKAGSGTKSLRYSVSKMQS